MVGCGYYALKSPTYPHKARGCSRLGCEGLSCLPYLEFSNERGIIVSGVNDLLVDNVGHVAITGGIVRIELQRLATLQGSSESPTFETSARLAFSLDTLIKLNQAITTTLANLESKGVVKRNDPKAADGGGAKKSVN